MNEERRLRAYVALVVHETLIREGFGERITDLISDKFGDYFKYEDPLTRKKSMMRDIRQFFKGKTIEDVIDEWIDSQEDERDIDVPDELRKRIQQYAKDEFDRRMKRPRATKEKVYSKIISDVYQNFSQVLRNLRTAGTSDNDIINMVLTSIQLDLAAKIKKEKKEEFLKMAMDFLKQFKRRTRIEDPSDAKEAAEFIHDEFMSLGKTREMFD